MNSDQPRCMINCDEVMKKVVVGVYARDEIPFKTERSFYCFVSNTDNSNQEGQHWVAFFVTSPSSGFFFDTLLRSIQRTLRSFSLVTN